MLHRKYLLLVALVLVVLHGSVNSATLSTCKARQNTCDAPILSQFQTDAFSSADAAIAYIKSKPLSTHCSPIATLFDCYDSMRDDCENVQQFGDKFRDVDKAAQLYKFVCIDAIDDLQTHIDCIVSRNTLNSLTGCLASIAFNEEGTCNMEAFTACAQESVAERIEESQDGCVEGADDVIGRALTKFLEVVPPCPQAPTRARSARRQAKNMKTHHQVQMKRDLLKFFNLFH